MANDEVIDQPEIAAEAEAASPPESPTTEERIAAYLGQILSELSAVRGQMSSLNSRYEVLITGQRELRAYVESLDEEARKTMEGMMSPDGMMGMAEKFMGGNG